MTEKQVMYDYLIERMAALSDKGECELFLQDLCTYAEIENMAQRLYSAKLILEGKTYAKVTEETQISSATLSRVSRCIKHGTGGYRSVIEKK